jgi:phage/plasmid-associated DNA primase
VKETRFAGFRDVSNRDPDRLVGTESASAETSSGNDEPSSEKEDGKKASVSPGDNVSPDPWDEARRLYEDEEGLKEARQAAARAARTEQAFATPGASGDLYARDPERGVFRPNGEESLREMLVEELGPHHSTREVRQIVAKVRAEASSGRLGTAKVIPIAGRDLSIGPLELLEPSSERPFLHRSPAGWAPSAECPSVLNDALRRAVASEEERRTLQEYAGYCLLHWARPYRKALLLVGPGREAKRVYLQALEAFVPWTASVAPSRLANRRAGGPLLWGPWANVSAGISPEALPEIEFFEEFGPGGPARSDPSQLDARREQPVPRRPTKHVYAAEELPDIYPGKSFFRRVQLISFADGWAPEGPEPQLARELGARRDGILQWALKGLRRLLRQEDFSLGRSPEETRKEWKAHGDPISRFKAEELEVTGDWQRHFEPKTKTYEAYRRFCQDSGAPIDKKQALTRQLKKDPRIVDGKRTPDGHDDQTRCYEGLLLRDGHGAEA